jgi:hypothetical protein
MEVKKYLKLLDSSPKKSKIIDMNDDKFVLLINKYVNLDDFEFIDQNEDEKTMFDNNKIIIDKTTIYINLGEYFYEGFERSYIPNNKFMSKYLNKFIDNDVVWYMKLSHFTVYHKGIFEVNNLRLTIRTTKDGYYFAFIGKNHKGFNDVNDVYDEIIMKESFDLSNYYIFKKRILFIPENIYIEHYKSKEKTNIVELLDKRIRVYIRLIPHINIYNKKIILRRCMQCCYSAMKMLYIEDNI